MVSSEEKKKARHPSGTCPYYRELGDSKGIVEIFCAADGWTHPSHFSCEISDCENCEIFQKRKKFEEEERKRMRGIDNENNVFYVIEDGRNVVRFVNTENGIVLDRINYARDSESHAVKYITTVPLRIEQVFEFEDMKHFRGFIDGKEILGSTADFVKYMINNGFVVWEKEVRNAVNGIIRAWEENGCKKTRGYRYAGVICEDGKFKQILPWREYIIGDTPGSEEVVGKIKVFGGEKSEYENMKTLEGYASLFKYNRRSILWSLFGYSAIAPFLFELKKVLNWGGWLVLIGPRGTKKSALCQLFTERLYGIDRKNWSEIESDFRFSYYISCSTYPITIEEIEKINQKIIPMLKAAAVSPIATSRGQRDQKIKKYYARAALIFNGNRLPITDEAMLSRLIVIYTNLDDKPENGCLLYTSPSPRD